MLFSRHFEMHKKYSKVFAVVVISVVKINSHFNKAGQLLSHIHIKLSYSCLKPKNSQLSIHGPTSTWKQLLAVGLLKFPFFALWVKFSADDILKYFFSPRKQDLTFHANCLQWRKFAWNVKSCFLVKICKNKDQFVICWNLPREW